MNADQAKLRQMHEITWKAAVTDTDSVMDVLGELIEGLTGYDHASAAAVSPQERKDLVIETTKAYFEALDKLSQARTSLYKLARYDLETLEKSQAGV